VFEIVNVNAALDGLWAATDSSQVHTDSTGNWLQNAL